MGAKNVQQFASRERQIDCLCKALRVPLERRMNGWPNRGECFRYPTQFAGLLRVQVAVPSSGRRLKVLALSQDFGPSTFE